MRHVIVNNPGIGSVLILQNITGYANKLRLLLYGKALTIAAKDLQDAAFNAMRDKYFATKSNRTYYNREYLSKPQSLKLEHILFRRKPPIKRMSVNSIFVPVLPGSYAELVKVVPHLRWQEEGTKASVDLQPYLICGQGYLSSIKKTIASGFPQAKFFDFVNRKNNIPNVGKVFYLRVVHPPLKGREFILTADFVVRTMGQRIVRESVKRTVKENK